VSDLAAAGLGDEQAVWALRLVLGRQGVLPDEAELRAAQQHLDQAVADARARGLADPLPATSGDLARAALEHLAAQDEGGRDLVARAVAIEPGPGEREPVTLAVGALVLLAFRTELRLEHQPGKGWKFQLHTKPLSDSAVGKILSQLIGTSLKP
jgi:hypothetical protein